MSTTLYRNKNRRRPRKSEAERRRRTQVQRKRLVALGVAEDKVEKMSANELREALRRPKKLVAKSA